MSHSLWTSWRSAVDNPGAAGCGLWMTELPATLHCHCVLMRPTLLPNRRRLWRDAHTVQFGTDPAQAVVVEFAESGTARVLDLLDGTRTEQAVLVEAADLGIEHTRAREVIRALRAAGLVVGAHTLLPTGLSEPTRQRLVTEALAIAARRSTGDRTPADVLRRRAAARIVVAGDGPLVAPIAAALAAAGIGHVDPAVEGWVRPPDVLVGGLLPADVDRARAIATTDAVVRAAPEVHTRGLRTATATLVVRVGTRMSPVLATRGVRTRGLPHLDVAVRDGVAVIGPLIRPNSSPCHTCFDLHRRDRDPAWPALAAQLATGRAADSETCSVTTGLAAAALAADEVLAFLEGDRWRTEGATVEVSRPGEVRRRTWSPHPGCDCRRRRRSTVRVPAIRE